MFFYIYNWLFGEEQNEYVKIKNTLKKTKTLQKKFYVPKKSEIIKQILKMKKWKTTEP